MKSRSYLWIYNVGLGLLAVVCVVRLVMHGGTAAQVLLAIAIVGLLCVGILSLLTRRVRCIAMHVSARRPGARVLPAFSAGEMVEMAKQAGVSRRGLSRNGGSPMAVAVFADRFEIWVKTEEGPRWTVPRTPRDGAVAIVTGTYGNRTTEMVLMTYGQGRDTRQALVMPAYRPLRATGGMVGDDLLKAMRELSEVGESV